MRTRKEPARQPADSALAESVHLARAIAAIKRRDPAHHSRIMRKLAKLRNG